MMDFLQRNRKLIFAEREIHWAAWFGIFGDARAIPVQLLDDLRRTFTTPPGGVPSFFTKAQAGVSGKGRDADAAAAKMKALLTMLKPPPPLEQPSQQTTTTASAANGSSTNGTGNTKNSVAGNGNANHHNDNNEGDNDSVDNDPSTDGRLGSGGSALIVKEEMMDDSEESGEAQRLRVEQEAAFRRELEDSRRECLRRDKLSEVITQMVVISAAEVGDVRCSIDTNRERFQKHREKTSSRLGRYLCNFGSHHVFVQFPQTWWAPPGPDVIDLDLASSDEEEQSDGDEENDSNRCNSDADSDEADHDDHDDHDQDPTTRPSESKTKDIQRCRRWPAGCCPQVIVSFGRGGGLGAAKDGGDKDRGVGDAGDGDDNGKKDANTDNTATSSNENTATSNAENATTSNTENSTNSSNINKGAKFTNAGNAASNEITKGLLPELFDAFVPHYDFADREKYSGTPNRRDHDDH
jgi:hypothetical protein